MSTLIKCDHCDKSETELVEETQGYGTDSKITKWEFVTKQNQFQKDATLGQIDLCVKCYKKLAQKIILLILQED